MTKRMTKKKRRMSRAKAVRARANKQGDTIRRTNERGNKQGNIG